MNWSKIRAPALGGAALLAATALTAILLLAALGSPAPQAIDVGRPGDAYFLASFYRPEADGGRDFRWSAPDSRLLLSAAYDGPLLLTMRLRGGAFAPPERWALQLLRDGLPVAAFATRPEPRTYRILLPPDAAPEPAGAGQEPLELLAPATQPGPDDPRSLGVALDAVAIAPPPGAAAPLGPLLARALALAWALALAALVMAGGRRERGPAGQQGDNAALVRFCSFVRSARGRFAPPIVTLLLGAALALWAWRDPLGFAWGVPTPPIWLLALATLALALAPLYRRVASRWPPTSSPWPLAPGPQILAALALGHLLLPAPLPWRGLGALLILGLPGALAARLLFPRESLATRAFLALCGALSVAPLLTLALQALPGPLAGWTLILASDLLAGALVWAQRRSADAGRGSAGTTDTADVGRGSADSADSADTGQGSTDSADTGQGSTDRRLPHHAAVSPPSPARGRGGQGVRANSALQRHKPLHRSGVLPAPHLHPSSFILLTLLLGALLRLALLGGAEFQGDEARALLLASAVVQGVDGALLSHTKGPVEALLPAGVLAIAGGVDELAARLPFALAGLGVLLAVPALLAAGAGSADRPCGFAQGRRPTFRLRLGPVADPSASRRAGAQRRNKNSGGVSAIGYRLSAIFTSAAGYRLAASGYRLSPHQLWALSVPVALLAVDGFAVGFARIVQYQSLVLLMSAGAFWCLWRFYAGDPRPQRHLLAAAALLAVGLLAHYDAAFVAPALAWLALAGGRRRGWRGWAWLRGLAPATLLGAGLLAGFYLPFALSESFARTAEYLAGRAAQGDAGGPPFNNLALYLNILSFYNAPPLVPLLAGAFVASLMILLLRSEVRSQSSGAAAALAAARPPSPAQRLGAGHSPTPDRRLPHHAAVRSPSPVQRERGTGGEGHGSAPRRQRRIRPLSLLAALALGAAALAQALDPRLFALPGGGSWAALAFGLPLAALCLLPGRPPLVRALAIWLAAPFLAEAFLIAEPRTHFYALHLPAALLIGLAVMQHATCNMQNNRLASPSSRHIYRHVVDSALRFLLATFCIGGFAYAQLVYLRQSPEYQRAFPAARPGWLRAGYGAQLPEAGYFGFPHRDGWKAAAELYATGQLAGSYDTNQNRWLAGWYMGAATRCPTAPDYYLIAENEASQYFPPGYHLHTVVTAGPGRAMAIYARAPVAGPPRRVALEELAAQFDARPTAPHTVGATLGELAPRRPLDLAWPGGARLRGYDLPQESLRPGDSATLTLYWQADRPQDGLTPAVELRDAGGRAALTLTPSCAAWPARQWPLSPVNPVPFDLTLPADLPPGAYTLHTGLHDESGAWQPRSGGAEAPAIGALLVVRGDR